MRSAGTAGSWVQPLPDSNLDWLTLSLYPLNVEGFEDAVLAGSVRTLRKHRPNVQVEIHSDEKIPTIRRFMSDLGFRGPFLFGGKLYDASIFDANIHRATENEYNRRTRLGLDFDPTKFVCDFFFIPVAAGPEITL